MDTNDDDFDHSNLKYLYTEFNNEFGDINGVLDVLKQFMALWEDEWWESLFFVHKNWDDWQFKNEHSNIEFQIPECLILMQAIKNGIYPGIKFERFSVDYDSFRNMYIFFEKLHSLYLGRELLEDDIWALYRSDLAERVLGVLDQFDVFKGSIFLKDEFYICLKEVSWDAKSQNLFCRINELFAYFLFENQKTSEISFNYMINNFIIILAHSAAIWSDSFLIRTEHVIKAYKTMFKIIKTEIPTMVNKKYYTGQLICRICSEVYALKEDEAPYDFSKCNCGGKLRYVSLSSESSR